MKSYTEREWHLNRRTALKSIAGLGIGLTLPLAADRGAGKTVVPTVVWNRIYGADGDSPSAFAVVNTSDGGYAFAGSITQNGTESGWLVKLDAGGRREWAKRFPSFEAFTTLVQASNGGFALGGRLQRADSYGGLLKTTLNGTKQWQKSFRNRIPTAVLRTHHEKYTLVGYVEHIAQDGTSNADGGWAVRLVNGEIKWNRTFGGHQYDAFTSLTRAQNGGYVFAGVKGVSSNRYSSSGWLVKTDSTGELVWSRRYRERGRFTTVRRGIDGGYIAAGAIRGIQGDDAESGWLLKVCEGGREHWSQTYHNPEFTGNIEYNSFVSSSDGGYVIVGSLSYYSDYQTGLVVGVDKTGHRQWKKFVSGPQSSDYDVPAALIRTPDGKYVFAGSTYGGEGGNHAWLVKLAP